MSKPTRKQLVDALRAELDQIKATLKPSTDQ